MSSTINDVRVAPGESAEAKRERRLQRRREERELIVLLKQRNNGKSVLIEEGSETGLGVQPSQSNKDKQEYNTNAYIVNLHQLDCSLCSPHPHALAQARPTMFGISLVGASLSEPHIDELNVRNLYICIYLCDIMVRPSPARRHIHCTATRDIFRRPHEETSALSGTTCTIIAESAK